MALIKIIDILEGDKYDLLILDTAPTGHTIRLLELPDLMTAYVKVIDKMHYDIEKIKATLKDSTKTKFIPITIPEAMSVYETERLINVLKV